MITESLGLRDRKRLETRERIEIAAVTLVARDGIELATVEAISALADVSPRTFFNYFDTKEDAILGLRDTDITPEFVEEHLATHANATTVESITHLLVSTFGSAITDSSIRAARLELVLQHPQLMGRQFAQMTRMTEQLTHAVRAILAHDDQRGSAPTGLPDAPPASTPTAELMLAICGAGVRASAMEMAAAHREPTTEQLQERAIELVREVVQKLA